MGVIQPLLETAAFSTAGVVYEANAREQAMDAEFLDAVCNGVVVIGEDFLITSQNYVSRANMGNLVGRCCYQALENRDTPCESCPRQAPIDYPFETAMRCAGKACSLYEVRIYPSEDGPEIVEVYPDMIDRTAMVMDLHLYREELDLLNSVVEDVSRAFADESG